MKDVLRPVLELTVVFPGLLLAYFPVGSYLKLPPAKLAAGAVPLLLGLCLGGGLFCYHFGISTAFSVLLITLTAIFLYLRTLRLSLWKSGTIALAVCAVFACLNSLSRAVGTAIVIRMQLPPDKPWFCFGACIFYNAVCWLITAAAYYPATHAVRAMVEDDNFAQTWYVFWVLPLVFILLNLFITPRYQITLRTGRVLQVYIVMSIALLFLMFMFNAIFLLMANSLNRNARLQQENQFLSMQQQRYESLKTAIDEARQARHDMRHQLNQISALAETGDLDGLKAYLAKTAARIPDLDMNFCENRAADSVAGYYCALAKREGIPFCARLNLPQTLPVDEMDLCLVLSNLLENAFEASLRTAPARRKIGQLRELLEAHRLRVMNGIRHRLGAAFGLDFIFDLLRGGRLCEPRVGKGLHGRVIRVQKIGCSYWRDVHGLRRELLFKRRRSVRSSLFLDELLNICAHLVCHLSDFRTLLGAELSHTAQHACQLAFLAEILHAQRFEVGIRLAQLCRRLGFDFFQHFFQNGNASFYTVVFNFDFTNKNRPGEILRDGCKHPRYHPHSDFS